MTKIDDVAKLARVSTATVSRALRGLPEVSETTRDRVLEAAAQLGYVASPSASRLAGGKTRSVAVVVPRLTRWFFATAVEAAEECLHQAGYDLLLYNLGGREHARQQLFRTADLHKRVDAMMLMATPLLPEDIAVVSRLAIRGVTVSSGTPVPGWSSVRIDDVGAARTAVEHLLQLGHRRIAHICGDAADELAHSAHIDRRRGYEEALCAAGLAVDPRLMVDADFSVAGGAAGAIELLGRGTAPTAIFAACDEMAMGAMAALRQAGLRVPGDVSVIGIDDHDLAAAVGLTTIAQPAADQGRIAAVLLLEPLHVGPIHVAGAERAGVRHATIAEQTDAEQTGAEQTGARQAASAEQTDARQAASAEQAGVRRTRIQHEPVATVLPTRLVVRDSTGPPAGREKA